MELPEQSRAATAAEAPIAAAVLAVFTPAAAVIAPVHEALVTPAAD